MKLRPLILWSLSGLLLCWIVALTWHTDRVERCVQEGGRWDQKRWTCVPGAGRIIIQRGMKRS